MKAERRHQLQDNSLIRGAQNFPQFWKDYGSKILLVIILFLLTVVLVRYWLNSREQNQQAVAEQLTSARVVLEQFRRGEAGPAVLEDDPQTTQFLQLAAQQFGDLSIPIMFLGPDAETGIRTRVRERVESAVNETLQKSSDATRQAEATLLRADLNLYFGLLAAAEATAAPASQPSTKQFEKTPDQYFDAASTSYEELVGKAAQIPPHIATAARFGLAAVHENRGNVSEARNLYDTIFKSGHSPTAKKLAGARIDLLARIPANPLIGPPMTSQAQTQPADTQPAESQPAATQAAATTQPATQPTTHPATQPTAQPSPEPTDDASSTTQPATQPAGATPSTTRAATQPATTPVTIP